MHDDGDDDLTDPTVRPTERVGSGSGAIELDAFTVVGLAFLHAGIRPIRSLRVANPTDAAWRDVVVSITADPPFAEALTLRIDSLEPGASHDLGRPAISLSPGFFAQQQEREPARWIVSVTEQGRPVGRRVHDLHLLAPAHWPGLELLPELLAAWVRPNSPALPPVLRAAADRLEALAGTRSLSGYQSRDPKQAWRTAQAIYEAVQASGVTYINPPASFETRGQKIRSHEQVVGGGQGTCLDLTVLLAALLEQAGLHPLLLVTQGHAFVGVWLTEFSLHEPVVDDPLAIIKRAELGEALVFDSSPVASGGSFEQARRSAERMIGELDRFVCAVDVHAARTWGVLPLPGEGESAGVALSRSTGSAGAVAEGGDALPARWLVDDGPTARTATRIDRWKGKLLDLSLRNKLLAFRPGKAAVPFPFSDLATLEDALAAGQSLSLLPRPEVRLAEAVAGQEGDAERARREALREIGLVQQEQGRILSDLPPAELEARLLEVYRRATTALQESGAVTLYLALGTLVWFEGPTATQGRCAPLILVPVTLVRPSRGGAWTLTAAGDETRVNVTLLEKLRADHGLDTTGLDVAPTDEQGIDVTLLLHRFRVLVKDIPRWAVVEDAWLGQFSFTKFLMWLDLEAKREALLRSPVVAQMLLGRGDGLPLARPLVEEESLDAGRPTQDTVTVTEADPSQLQAILAASDGSSFVLQGPPGTGKSQTITNVIAHLVGQGKSVLFVSEKIAALQVVHRRLEKVGLGPFSLEVHSAGANKRAVVEQLKASFAHAAQRPPAAWQTRLGELQRARDDLNAHVARLAAPTPFGQPVRDVLASLFGLRDVPVVLCRDVDPATLTPQGLRERQEAAHALRVVLDDVGEVAGHPWRGVRRSRWTPAWERDLGDAMASLAQTADALGLAVTRARRVLALPEAEDAASSLEAIAELRGTADWLLATPAPPRALLEGPGTRERLGQLRERVAHGAAVAARQAALSAQYRPELFTLDLDALRARFDAWAQAFFLFAWVMLFSARRQLARVAQGPLGPSPEVASQLVEAVGLRGEIDAVEAWSAQARDWLGAHWEGLASDWQSLGGVLSWAERGHTRLVGLAADPATVGARDRVLALATEDAEQLAVSGPVRAALDGLLHAGEAWDAAWARVQQLGDVDTVEALGDAPSLPTLAAWARGAHGALDRLRPWCDGVEALAAMRALGVGPIVDALLEGAIGAQAIERTLERSLREAWWDRHLEETPDLARFRGIKHADLVERFRALEAEALAMAQQIAVCSVAERVPDPHAPGDEMALLRRQLTLKSRHMPLRKLFTKVPTLLQRLKPCMLMSPLSVAQFLDPELAGFDVVVFDEASQIPPWDAVGAIARGNQVIIVGDSKQLPPTSFFDHGGDDDEPLDDEDLEEVESILDEALASGMPELRLRWHYRSRHESLIAFSNHHYYDNTLHTFPSADHAAPGRGVQLEAVPDGFYDRGRSRTNRAEAEATVAELVRLLRLPDGERPTVGVVTFSMAQQRLVEDLVEAAVAEQPELAIHFTDAVPEKAFVKNLENVQGDERDVMLFCIGYGPDRQGRVTMNFGPLNRKGGERRLNVAVTRARERLVVYSTLRADQIDLSRTQAIGVHHLKSFLRYAELGMRSLDGDLDVGQGLWFESPFEEEVHQALVAAGHVVHTQVGCSGYRIDLAVVDRARPGAYVLAVECDGATYHGSRNARARDRLRDGVLGSLGWRIHRVWSTDWWYQREATTQRLLAAVADAMKQGQRGPVPPVRPPSAPTPPAAVDVDALLAQGPGEVVLPPGCTPWGGLPSLQGGDKDSFHASASLPRIARDIAVVVRATSPVMADDVWRHVAAAWGWSGLGKRIVARCEDALRALPGTERPVLREGVLWAADKGPASYTTFRPGQEGGPVRDAVAIPIGEVGNAVAWVVRRGVSMSREAAAREAAAVFGLHRLGKNVSARMQEGVSDALARGLVRADGDRLTAP